jgi:hypothetical protein
MSMHLCVSACNKFHDDMTCRFEKKTLQIFVLLNLMQNSGNRETKSLDCILTCLLILEALILGTLAGDFFR